MGVLGGWSILLIGGDGHCEGQQLGLGMPTHTPPVNVHRQLTLTARPRSRAHYTMPKHMCNRGVFLACGTV